MADYARRRALVLRIGALGDLVLTRRLTFSLSLAGIATTLAAPARHARLLRADPWIEAVVDSESPAFAPAFEGLWPTRADSFDVAIVVSRSESLIAAARGAARRVLVVSPEPARDDRSIALQFAQEASAVATPFEGALPALPVDSTLATFPGRVVLHPGSGSPRKNWPADRFVAVGLALRDAGQRVLWARGPAEDAAPAGVRAFDLLDGAPLETLAATLASARAFVGNDSGVSHLAAAVGAPVLAIFGPTSDLVWRPDSPAVRTLRAAGGRLESLSAEEVLAALSSRFRAEKGA